MPELTRANWAAKVDLSSAYHHIPIHKDYKKFFAFCLNGHKYWFNGMPFGLSSAPYLFTRLMQAITAHLRVTYGMRVFAYLDDFLILGVDRPQVNEHLHILRETLTGLGLTINEDKSHNEPSQHLVFLGIDLNLINKTYCASQENIDKCLAAVKLALRSPRLCLREYQALMGTLNFTCASIEWGYTLFKPIACFANSFSEPRVPVTVPQLLRERLRPLADRQAYRPCQLRVFAPRATLLTDASLSGWGGMLVTSEGQQSFQGTWSPEEKLLNINILETQAVLNCCKALPSSLDGQDVMVRTDNVSAKAAINKGGSAACPVTNRTVRFLLQHSKEKNRMIRAEYLPGSQNVAADGLSRSDRYYPDECCLAQDTFQRVCRRAGVVPVVDLFATKDTTQLPAYYSSLQDSASLGLDAFTGNWETHSVAYAFPPERLIYRLLYKWEHTGNGLLILIAPYRKSAPWFPSLINLSIKSFQLPQDKRGLYINQLDKKQFLTEPLRTLWAFVLQSQH